MILSSWQAYKQALARYPLLVKATTAGTIMSLSDGLCQVYERRGYQQILDNHQEEGDDGGNNCKRKKVVNLQNGCPVNLSKVSSTTSPATTNRRGSSGDANTNNHNSQLLLLQYNWERTMHVAFTGFTFSGPISHWWYNLLERMVGGLSLAPFGLTTTTTIITASNTTIALKMLLDAILFSPIAVAGYFVWRSILEGSDVRWKLQNKWMGALQASWSFWPMANILNFSLIPLQFRVLYNNLLSVVWNAYLSNVNQSRLEEVVQLQLIGGDDNSLLLNKDNKNNENVDGNKTTISSASSHPPPPLPKLEPCVCSHCRSVRG